MHKHFLRKTFYTVKKRNQELVHDYILALGRVVRKEKNKEFKASFGSKFRVSLGYTRLCLKSHSFTLNFILLPRESIPLFLGLSRHKS